MRQTIFANNEYYHIYNRGVNKQDVFLDKDDYWKFFNCLRDFNNRTYYEERLGALGLHAHSKSFNLNNPDFKELGSFLKQQEKVVDIVSYSLPPNHFHLIVRQLQNKGISNLMHRVGLSMTNYFNKKYKHSGHVFQGPFKVKHIDEESYLLWLLGYTNGNPEIHGLGKASDYSWSSYDAIRKALGSFLKISELSVLSGLEIIKAHFTTAKEFEEFVQMVIKESRTKKEMKKYLLE